MSMSIHISMQEAVWHRDNLTKATELSLPLGPTTSSAMSLWLSLQYIHSFLWRRISYPHNNSPMVVSVDLSCQEH